MTGTTPPQGATRMTNTTNLPTREATATVYKIEADLIETTAFSGSHTWLLGNTYVTARVDIDGTDYTWRVTDPRRHTIGDTMTVTVPA